MGTAWHSQISYPWEQGLYVGGIETVKVNIMLRIYANKWHVYAGLAILNPHARIQIDQYAASVTAIYKLMLDGKQDELRDRVFVARAKVFPESEDGKGPIFLSESILDQFTLSSSSSSMRTSASAPTPGVNSHLSILAMVDSWAQLSIQPFAHLALAATPIFRLWIGVAEALYRNTPALERAISASCMPPSPTTTSHRADDLEFVIAARGWSQCVHFGSFRLYEERFERTRAFFEGRFKEAEGLAGRMIKLIAEDKGGEGKKDVVKS